MRAGISFDDNWFFTKPGEERVSVTLPHTWNAIDGQDGSGGYWRGECIYEKDFPSPETEADHDVYLEFDGVSASAKVTLNGHFIGEHYGGYSRFRFNITDHLRDDGNRLSVTVSNAACDTVYPQNTDFTLYGGIYRPVRLITVHRIRFDMDTLGDCGVRVTPKVLDDGSADVEVAARTTGGNVKFFLGRQCLEGNNVTFRLDNPDLWGGRRQIPCHMYTLYARLFDGDILTDELDIPFGIRSFRIDPEEGFFLNGKSYPLRGAAMHQDRIGLGSAITEYEMEQSIRQFHQMGATSVRLVHYQHAQYVYDVCDRLGIVVWTEIPYFGEHLDNASDNALSQMREMIAQNYNHPSIVVWGLSSGIAAVQGGGEKQVSFHRKLNDLCHLMDPARLTAIACVSSLPVDHPLLSIPDALCYNRYFGRHGGQLENCGPWFDRFHALHPGIPIGISEYGCENSLRHSSHPEPGDCSNEYQMIYHESLIKQLYSRKYLWAAYAWNMFDYASGAPEEGGSGRSGNMGLIAFDHVKRKDTFFAYLAWLSDFPVAHLCGRDFVDRDGDTTEFVVYSNQPEVTLTVNGVPYTQQADDHFFRFTVPQPEGVYTVSVSGLFKEATFRHTAGTDPAYRIQQGTAHE